MSRPAIGLLAGIAVAAACWWSGGRLALRIATVAAFAGAGVYVVAEQVRYHYLPTIDWPADLSAANDIAWLALALLGADMVVGLMRTRYGSASTLQARNGRLEKGPSVMTSAPAAGGEQVALGVVVALVSAAFYDLGYVLEKQALAPLPRLTARPVVLVRTVSGPGAGSPGLRPC